ncbi:MAG: hypothetical protein R3253_08475, partial [Longimicrobiales bacterium]|nr:hypothetical protein [Longimicrobiales bacterium]
MTLIRSLVALVLLLSTAAVVNAQETTLLRNGRLLDGSGNPWIYADVLIRGDRIEAVGDLDGVTADAGTGAGRGRADHALRRPRPGS